MAVYRGVFLYGDSGNGKSSLVNAGLLPRAHGLGLEPIRVRVQPRDGEELVVDQIAIADGGGGAQPFVFAPENDATMRVVLSIAEFEGRLRAAPEDRRPLIVFDQFEEILTLFEDDDAVATRRAIGDMIGRLLNESLPVKVVFAFREDYLGRVRHLLADHPELVDQALRLGPPSADDLEKIIRGPFERFPGHYERELNPALAQRLQGALSERFGTGEVSLSEVQTVCLRLWHSPDPEALLTEKGVQGLLEEELGEALDRFTPELRGAAVALLSQMVTAAGTRNVISAEDLRLRVQEENGQIPVALLDEALERLESESKLVRRERRRDLYLYEITSEFLVPWISRRREELRLAHEHQRERRRLRIFASIAGGLLVLAVLMAGAAIWALEQRSEARTQATNAMSLALASSSEVPLSDRPYISLALGFEAYRLRPRPESGAAVVRALPAARQSGLRGILTSSDELSSVAFSPDGKTIAAGSDNTVLLWDLATRDRRAILSGHTKPVLNVAFSPDGKTLASASDDGTIGLWDVATGKRTDTLEGHTDGVNAVAFSPDGRTLASASDDGTIGLWSLATGRLRKRLEGHDDIVYAIAFSPDGTTLASASADTTVGLWDLTSAKQIDSLEAHDDQAFDVAFSPDGRALASASADTTAVVWDVATGKDVATFDHPANEVNAVAFSPDGKTLASTGNDDARLWSVATHKQLAHLTGHTYAPVGIAFGRDGKSLATVSSDSIRLWNPAVRTARPSLDGHTDTVYSVAFSPDGKTLASSSRDSMIGLWDPATRRRRHTLEGHEGRAYGLAFSPDGESLASSGEDGTVRRWSVASGEPAGVLTRAAGSVWDVAFSPDAKVLAFGGDDELVHLWDLAMQRELGTLAGHDGRVYGVAFSPDGKTLASASYDDTARLWNVATRKLIKVLEGHTDTVRSVAFSPDGETLATASDDDAVRLWNVASGKPIGALAGHTEVVNDATFSPDGKILASGGYDSEIRLWNPASRKPIGTLTGHEDWVRAVAFSPDGKTLASASDDDTVGLWNQFRWDSLAELRASVCDMLGTGLTRSDWAQYAGDVAYRRTCP